MTHNILSLLSLLALAGCGQAPPELPHSPARSNHSSSGRPPRLWWSNCSKAKAARPARLPTPT